jgi:PRTRC genetic system protein E
MSKVNFFTELFSLLEDKESIELKVQRTGDELTVLLVPKIKGKTATITICGSPEDLNEGFMEQLTIPVEKIKGLVSNAAEVKIEDADDSDEEEEEEDGKEKPEAKKAALKKAAAKKSATKKVEEEKPKVEEPVEEINPEGKSTEEVEAEIERQRIEEEEVAKEAAEKVAQEKAEKEAEEKQKAEEAALLQEAFELAIKNGDEAFEARKYEEAEKHYQDASTLMPDHKAAKEKFEKANKWVKQLIAAGIIVREEVSNVNG